ncbi:hypothetical protein NG796_20695 [Laspinema sp. A4]|nr:hypothetical protein [Laspinema sp. D2d]
MGRSFDPEEVAVLSSALKILNNKFESKIPKFGYNYKTTDGKLTVKISPQNHYPAGEMS